MTLRAKLYFPTAIPMDEDVVWRRDIYRKHQFKNIGKEIHLTICWLYRIIQGSIGIICEIEFPIDVSSPKHIDVYKRQAMVISWLNLQRWVRMLSSM